MKEDNKEFRRHFWKQVGRHKVRTNVWAIGAGLAAAGVILVVWPWTERLDSGTELAAWIVGGVLIILGGSMVWAMRMPVKEFFYPQHLRDLRHRAKETKKEKEKGD